MLKLSSEHIFYVLVIEFGGLQRGHGVSILLKLNDDGCGGGSTMRGITMAMGLVCVLCWVVLEA